MRLSVPNWEIRSRMSPRDDARYKYRIEKQQLSVTLVMLGGEAINGHIFVQPSAFHYGVPEEPLHLFNSPEPFLPLEQDDGDVLLVAKDRVLEVVGVAPSEEDEVRRLCARPALLEITMGGGVVHLGSMRLETPSDRPR